MNSFWYLGSPYSKYFGGRLEAHFLACRAAAQLIKAGVLVFSPIAHSHMVAEYGRIDPCDHRIWSQVNVPFMRAARGIIVLELEGWEQSVGLKHEIAYMDYAKKRIVYMTQGTIPEEL